MSGKKKNYLIDELVLDNFMIHKNTTIKLSQAPITLITGANGSGKTQILDALILALGHTPKRLKKGNIEEFIGPFKEHANIKLRINNKKIQGARSISVSDPQLSEIIDHDIFIIGTNIHSKAGVSYYIEAKDQKRKLMKKNVRYLFECLNIRADNKLAFTEEGTVNIFADHSPRSKLELLLETTGLTSYKNNLIKTMESLDKAITAISPLKRKFSIENEYLKSMEKSLEIMRTKSQMLQRHKNLIVEEAWSYVVTEEKELQQILSKIYKKRQEYDLKQSEFSENEEKRYKIEEEVKNTQTQKDDVYKSLEKEKGQLGHIDGQNESNRRVIKISKDKLEQAEERREELLSSKLSEKEQKQLQKKLLSIKKQKQKIERIMKVMGDDFFSEKLTAERVLLQNTLEFYTALKKKKISFKGPLFHIISPQKEENWKDICKVLGKHLFTFLIQDEKDFQKAIQIYLELYQENAPLFYIVLCKGKQESGCSLFDTRKTDSSVFYFIEHILKRSLETSSSKNIALLSQKEDKELIQKNVIYFPWCGISGVWIPEIYKALQTLEIEELQEALQALETYKNIKEEEKQLQEILDEDIEQEVHFLEKRIEEIQEEIKEIEEEIAENNYRAGEIETSLLDYQNKHREIQEQLKEKKQKLEKTEKQSFLLEDEQETLEKTMNILEQKKEEKENLVQEKLTQAKEQGDRPEEIRNTKAVSEEKIYLEGKLETLQYAPITEEEFLRQEKKVAELEKELSGNSEHLENLKIDTEKRYKEWHKEVGKKIKGISKSMNHLLSLVPQHVRLRVDNLKKIATSALHIEVKRHTDKWHDLAHLSGGEKVLTIESLILSLHLQTDSPIHAIDECTQRLDLQFKSQSFEMVRQAIIEIEKHTTNQFAPQFILLAPDTLGINFNKDADAYFKRIVLSSAKLKSKN